MKFTARHPTLLFGDIGFNYFNQLVTACPGGESEFRARYLPVAEKLAVMVQDLPLEKNVFAHPGGALQFGLVCGLTALRLSDGVIFDPSASAQRRMIVEPQYKYAAWCAALAGVPLLVHHLSLITVAGEPWSFASKPSTLYEACKANGEYEMDWKPATAAQPSAALGSVLLKDFFYSGQFEHFDHAVLAGMCQAVNPALTMVPGEQSLSRVVRVAQEKVKTAELLRMSEIFSSAQPTANRTADLMDVIDKQSTKSPDVPTISAEKPQSVTPFALGVVATQAVPANSEVVPIPTKITSWVRAVVANQELATQFRFLDDLKMVDVTIDQLRFGGSAAKTFKDLEDGGYVHSKVAGTSARLNKALRDYIQLQLTKQGNSHAQV